MTVEAPAPTAEDARSLARALVGEAPTAEEITRWQAAVAACAGPLARPIDRALWSLARRGEPALGLVDAGLALSDPYSPVRHRLYLMLAVLEASPAHVARFEAPDRPALSAGLALAARGALAVARSLGGLVLVVACRVVAR